MRPIKQKGTIMSENTPDITTLPVTKKSFFNKTNAIRVAVAAVAVTVVAVLVIKLKSDSAVEEIVETVTESLES